MASRKPVIQPGLEIRGLTIGRETAFLAMVLARLLSEGWGASFTEITNTGIAWMEGEGLAWGDYDLDGDLDLLANSYVFQSSLLFRNGDARQDILVAGYGTRSGYTHLWRFDDEGFSSAAHSFPGLDGYAQWLDCGGDGDLDVLMQGTFYLNHPGGTTVYRDVGVLVFRKDGLEKFNAIQIADSALTYYGGISWGDVNSDGRIDLAYSGADPARTRILRNLGDCAFGLPVDVAPPWGGPMRFADFDNDRDLDMMLIPKGAGAGGGPTLHRFRNNQVRPNAAPDAPRGLIATVTKQDVTLAWNPTTDANQASGHSCAIRVGTSPQSGNVIGQPADSSTGHRRQPILGNAGPRSAYFLRDLPSGRYSETLTNVHMATVG